MRLSIGSVILLLMGLFSAIPGLLAVSGLGALLHPLLNDRLAGIALLAIAVSCIGAAFFPLVAVTLTRRENSKR